MAFIIAACILGVEVTIPLSKSSHLLLPSCSAAPAKISRAIEEELQHVAGEKQTNPELPCHTCKDNTDALLHKSVLEDFLLQ